MFQKTTLPNGLRVITSPMPAAKSVAVMVMVAAGSRYETKPTSGIAHFAEHMFFKGTEKRPTAKDISAEVDGIGGEFNAFTGKEYTGYYIKCAAEHRELALDVLADQLLSSRFDPEEIEREKGVIIEELNMYVDTPRDHVDSVYDQLLFGDQPLGWDIIGTKDTIRAAERDTFLSYLDSWYAPRRLVVGAGGAVDDGFVAEVERHFGHLADRSTGDALPVEVRPDRGSRAAGHPRLRPGAPAAGRPRHRDHQPRPLRHAGADGDPRRRHVVAAVHRGARAPRPRLLRLRLPPELRRRRHPVRAGRRRHRADRPGGLDDRQGVPHDGRRDGARGRAAPLQELPEGPARAAARGPARAADVRAAPRGAREPAGGARGAARRDRGGDGRGHPAAGPPDRRRRRPELRAGRAVRRPPAVPRPARGLA